MTFIDFFGGAGFIRKGMELAGHKGVGYCEIDKFAVKSYYAIYGKSEDEWYERDIRTANTNRIPDAECYCAGFPCQAFSIAGKRGGFEDMRGTLVFEVFRLANIKRPRILFLENVEGLLNHDGGRTFGTILSAMDELGYDAQWQLLNTKNFGIPQNRERVFIVGHLRGTSRPEVFPITGTDSKTLKQVIGGSQGNRVYDANGVSITFSSQGGGMGAKTGLYLINKNQGKITFREDFNCVDANYYKGLGAHQARTGILEVKPAKWRRTEKGKQVRRENQKTSKDYTPFNNGCRELVPKDSDVIGTITSQAIAKDSLLFDHTRIRRLTPRECWRLQGAKDEDFEKAAAVNSESQLYKQAGNGATVNVIYEIAKRLL